MREKQNQPFQLSFNPSLNRRDGCKIGTVFEVKKEIPARVGWDLVRSGR
jgi:hypothetical protein